VLLPKLVRSTHGMTNLLRQRRCSWKHWQEHTRRGAPERHETRDMVHVGPATNLCTAPTLVEGTPQWGSNRSLFSNSCRGPFTPIYNKALLSCRGSLVLETLLVTASVSFTSYGWLFSLLTLSMLNCQSSIVLNELLASYYIAT